MRPFEPFLLQHLPFRYRSSIWMDKYLEYMLFQKIDSKYFPFVYGFAYLVLNGTIGQRFMQIQHNLKHFKILKFNPKVLILAIAVSRYIQFKFPIFDDVLWLLNIQGFTSIFSLENIFCDFEMVESDKVSDILGYISSVVNIAQFWQKVRAIPKFEEFICPPYLAYTSFKCCTCNINLIDKAVVDKKGLVYCTECSQEGRTINLK